MTPFSIVPFVSGHLAELVDLWVVSWQQAIPEIDFETRRAWIVDRLGAIGERGDSIFCAFDASNGTMAGFVTVETATGWIDQLAVANPYKGSGAASCLLSTARRQAPEGVHLDVNEKNRRARAFYAREGFVETGRGVNAASGFTMISMAWKPPPARY